MNQDARKALLTIGGLILAGLVVDYYARQPGPGSIKVGQISGVSGSVTVAGTIYGGGFPALSPVPGGCRCGMSS